MQRSTVRRADGRRAEHGGEKARVGSAFGAMPVHHGRRISAQTRAESLDSGRIPQARLPRDLQANYAEPIQSIEPRELVSRAGSVVRTVADEADREPALGLSDRKVVDVPERSPEREAQYMQNRTVFECCGHCAA